MKHPYIVITQENIKEVVSYFLRLGYNNQYANGIISEYDLDIGDIALGTFNSAGMKKLDIDDGLNISFYIGSESYEEHFIETKQNKSMQLTLKADVGTKEVHAAFKAEIDKAIKSTDFTKLIEKSIDDNVARIVSNKLERRLNGGSFLDGVYEAVVRRAAKDVDVNEILKHMDKNKLVDEVAKSIIKQIKFD